MDLERIGLHVPDILLPREGTDMARWAVIACDQYASQPEYWEDVKGLVGDAPSALELILPEAYLGKADIEQADAEIRKNMQRYLDELLVAHEHCFIAVDRKLSSGKSRKGLIVAVDLETYDGLKPLIKPTEATIAERMPARVMVRENAPLELPHTMVLIDDPDKTVIEPLFEPGQLEKRVVAYDFDLMNSNGHLTGYRIDDDATISAIAKNLAGIFNGVFLYAVGDGNHSFKAAKQVWERLKQDGAAMDHPARYALVELVNIHNDGLQFKPIHRVVSGIDTNDILEKMALFYNKGGSAFAYSYLSRENAMRERQNNRDKQFIPFLTQNRYGVIGIVYPPHSLDVGTLQSFLDFYAKHNPSARIDYVHGEEAVTSLASEPNTIGFYMRAMPKQDFFGIINSDGKLPIKAFSIGSADEKRFYVEARRISV